MRSSNSKKELTCDPPLKDVYDLTGEDIDRELCEDQAEQEELFREGE